MWPVHSIFCGVLMIVCSGPVVVWMRMAPHELLYLSVWFLLGGTTTFWEGLGGVALLEVSLGHGL